MQLASLGLHVYFVEILTLSPFCTKGISFQGTHGFLLLTIKNFVWKAVTNSHVKNKSMSLKIFE